MEEGFGKGVLEYVNLIPWGLSAFLLKEQFGGVKKIAADMADKHTDLIKAMNDKHDEQTKVLSKLGETLAVMAADQLHHKETDEERHGALWDAIKTLGEELKLQRKRTHWLINKLTAIKLICELRGDAVPGEWNVPELADADEPL